MYGPTFDVTLLHQPSELSAPVTAYRNEVVPDHWKSLHYDLPVFRSETYGPGNALTTSPQYAVLWRDPLFDYQPKTELGRRLLAIRQAYVASGGQLLSAAELDEELRLRRGGVSDA